MHSAGLQSVGKDLGTCAVLVSVGMCVHGSCQDRRKTWPSDEALWRKSKVNQMNHCLPMDGRDYSVPSSYILGRIFINWLCFLLC